MAGNLKAVQQHPDRIVAEFERCGHAGPITFVRLQTKEEVQNAISYHPRALAACSAAKFRHFPIVDQNVADDARVVELVDELVVRMEAGEALFLHCKGGHGRTGTICSVLLGRLYGLGADAALRYVQAAHDAREHPKFYGTSKTGVADAMFPVQIEQVRRMLS